jgi:2-polyprenyl-3-methyl-5-hydroxy-6-metoxy-1,4-benzoquinol methylase
MTDQGTKSAIEAYREGTDYQFDTPELQIGPWTSYSLLNDPKHLSFVLARYKFVTKLLEGKSAIMEVGPGDGFGLPMIAQAACQVYAVDWDARLLEGNARRLNHLKNVTYLHLDLNKESPQLELDAAFSVDVLEHIQPQSESTFIGNIVSCLKPTGILVTGTPNLTASQYASPRSLAQHINLKSMHSLRRLMERYFYNVFMFGQNDEVVHTGYAPMCHYIWSLAVGVRPLGGAQK